MAEDKLVVEHLDVDNYATWSVRMKALLMVKGLWKAVTGEDTDVSRIEKAQAQIALHVKGHHLLRVMDCPNAKGAWEMLKAAYEGKSNARKLALRHELAQLRMDPAEPVAMYVGRAKDIQTKLQQVGYLLPDQDLAFTVMAGLTPAFGMISTVLMNADRELSLDDVLPKLLQAELLMQPGRHDETALFAKPGMGRGKKPGKGSGGPPRPKDGKKEKRTCFYCKMPGHIKENCFKWKRDQAAQSHNALAGGPSTDPAIVLLACAHSISDRTKRECEEAIWTASQPEGGAGEEVTVEQTYAGASTTASVTGVPAGVDASEPREFAFEQADAGSFGFKDVPTAYMTRSGSVCCVSSGAVCCGACDEYVATEHGEPGSITWAAHCSTEYAIGGCDDHLAMEQGELESYARAGAFVSTSNTYRWVLDSGASRHITPDESILIDKRSLDEPIVITFGNGGTKKTSVVGDVLLRASDSVAFMLKDVLHVPGASEHLLSVRTATRNGVEFKFGRDACHIMRDGEAVAAASCTGDLIYYLTGECARPAGHSALAMSARGETPLLWHKRFGHLGYDNLVRLRAHDMVSGISTSADEFKAASAQELCESCAIGKMHRLPFKASESKTTRPLALLHTDVCGPMSVVSKGGNAYFATVLDDYSKLSVVRCIARKSETPSVIKDIIVYLETQTGLATQRLRCDNGSEYINAELKGFCKERGIKIETTVRYTPEQNGGAERLNRTLVEKVRPMLADTGLPKHLWAEALSTANHVRNRSPVSGRAKTPWELAFGSKPDVSYFRAFGCRAFVHIPKQLRDKLSPVSEAGRFIGYPSGTKGYKILTDTGRVVVSRDVTFVEMDKQPSITAHPDSDEEDEEPVGAAVPQPAGQGETPPGPPPIGKRPRREARDVPASVWRDEGYMITGRKRNLAGLAYTVSVAEPLTMEEALSGEQADEWRIAMDDEFGSLVANKTWTLEKPPPGVTPIPVKWVYKVKRDAHGDLERYKARLVVKGYRQREGIDFQEVFAPVSKYSTLRTVLSIAAAEDMKIHQLDIKTAFLNGELEEDVWCEQPQGYESGEGLACHLRKSLYGLKQAPRAWHLRLKAELEKMSFKESCADPGLFLKEGEKPVYLLIYVDDIALVTKDTTELQATKRKIMETFEARDLGPCSYFLGMDVIRDRENRTIMLMQRRMTADLLAKYDMTEAKSLSTPLSTSVKLTKDGEPLDKEKYPYSQLIGSLMYISICTRPDIAQAVGALARYMATPTETHWQVAKGVLRYLAGTANYGIMFGNSDGLEAYCDADYAGDLDSRRSTTGYLFTLNGGAISWSSRLQQTVAASTTEAEYMAAAAAIKEALWMRRLLAELGQDPGTIAIKADSQSAIKLLKNPIISMRSKHIDVIYHFARERVAKKDVAFEYIRTDYMAADSLTKALPASKFDFCRTAMGVIPHS